MSRQQDMFADIAPDPAPVEPSATVHDILRAKGGRRGATAFANQSLPEAGRHAPVDLLAGPRGPRIIAAAAETAEALAKTGSPEGAAGHVYSGWCMLGLPYRRPKGAAEQAWRIDTPYAAIIVEGGSRPLDNGSLQQVGVPFGAYARVLQIAVGSECLEGTVNLSGRERNETGGVSPTGRQLCHPGNAGDLGPGLEGLDPGGSILVSGKMVAAEMEEVVDPVVGREKALRLAS